LGLVDKPLARPLLGLRAISAACPEACCPVGSARPTLTFPPSASLHFPALQHVKTEAPFFSLDRSQAFTGLTGPCKSPTLRVWLPSRRCKLFCPRKPLSAFHALGLRPSEPCSSLMAHTRFPEHDPLLRFPAKPVSLTSTLQRLPLTKPAVQPAPRHTLMAGWCPCSLELRRLSGLPPLDMGRSTFLPPAPLVLCSSSFRRNSKPEPQGFPSNGIAILLAKDASPSGVSDRQPLLLLRNVSPSRPIFSVWRFRTSYELGKTPPCNRLRPA
jgi:hypothetical protein